MVSYNITFLGPTGLFSVKSVSTTMVLSRFCEWGQACWELQRDFFLGSEPGDKKWDVRFVGVYNDNDTTLDQCKQLITGRALDQWWDKSEESGPATRASERFSEDPPPLECLSIADGALKTLGLFHVAFFLGGHGYILLCISIFTVTFKLDT